MDIRNLSPAEKEKYLEYLSSFITAKRRKKIREVVQERTRYLTLVLEIFISPTMPVPFFVPANVSEF